MSDAIQVVHSARSEIGRRSSNDDAVFVDEEAGLYVVCDGTRGHFGGRNAGQLAVHGVQTHLNELRGGYPTAIDESARRMVDSLVATAHTRITAAQASDPDLTGMATTFASVFWRGAEALVSHVGDTRVYLHRGNQLTLLTEDHNLDHYMRQHPEFKPKVAYSGKTLVRALGLKQAPPRVDHRRVAVQKDDLLLISTDGLTDATPEITVSTILSTIEINSVEEVSSALVRAALGHGTMDNVSLVVLHATDGAVVAGPRTEVFELGNEAGSSLVLGWLAFLDKPHKGQVVPLAASTVVGADPGCAFHLEEEYISSRHAEFLRTQHGFVLRDLGSTNGTFINNVKVVEPHGLVDGDRVRMGRTEMIFKSYAHE
jgi:serine/threonine protein phosphatase PrpC